MSTSTPRDTRTTHTDRGEEEGHQAKAEWGWEGKENHAS